MQVGSDNQLTFLCGANRSDLHRLRETANRAVGSVFFGTLLKAMRDSTLQGPYGHGGRGEEVFTAQLHGIFAERIGDRQEGLGDAIFRSLSRQQELIGRRRDATLEASV